jgi:hypothetical protein
VKGRSLSLSLSLSLSRSAPTSILSSL